MLMIMANAHILAVLLTQILTKNRLPYALDYDMLINIRKDGEQRFQGGLVMKSRLFVVDENTIKDTKNDLIASVMSPDFSNPQWLKTLADIMADMLQVEIGDYIFLWERGSKENKSRIHGVYRAISKPYYEMKGAEDNAPFKIHIEKAYEFKNPVDEYEVLNNPYNRNPVWTIIGKKVAGKARGSTPLSLEETQFLITSLIDKNSDWKYYPYSGKVIGVSNELEICYSRMGKADMPSGRESLDIKNICFVNNNDIPYEKILETIFNQEFSKKNAKFFEQIDIVIDKVKWFSNYLPYSIEQSEMDYVIMESEDNENISRITVIDFQKAAVDDDHIRRVMLYSKWINDTLAYGCSVTRPVIICKSSYDFINGETKQSRIEKLEKMEKGISECKDKYNVKDLEIYEYDFSHGQPSFTKKK